MGNGLRAQARRVLLQQVASAYHNASGAQRQHILEDFVRTTSYARKHAQWLISHAEEVLAPPTVLRRRSGPEVEEALVLAWNTLNRLCAKRLIPFLPDLLERLEEQGHVQLSQQHRSQLLSMSAATADRLLQAHRYTPPRGISTTKAGPLLKEQIPIRTYAQWDDAKPAFLEVDLVTHCGGRLQGGCLYTMTLTDVATGWTECVPLRNRGREAVLVALHRVRARFPFPILGLDTDNGGAFINEEVAAYCVREQITFTRGRPYEKRDQCFVEQKNGVVVRQVVGHGRLIGEQAYRQLEEWYRALHWYANCFQPSMKLVSKQIEGRTIHRIYDPAKTPLQRVLLSEVLSPSQQQELCAIGKAFDPLRLFQQVEQLQQTIFRCEAGRSSAGQSMPTPKLLPFDLAGCVTELVLPQARAADAFPQQEQEHASVLNWRRTSKDPSAGHWGLILSWVQANPTRSSGDILRELQLLSPGRYEGSHLRTLQRGMRKIRAHLLQTQQEAAPPELRGEQRLFPAEPLPARPGPDTLDPSSFREGERTRSPGSTHLRSSDQRQVTEEQSLHSGRPTRGPVCVARASSMREASQIARRSSSASSGAAISRPRPEKK